jgi:hypothetical protein
MKPLEEMEASILGGAPYDYGHDMLDLIAEVKRLNTEYEACVNDCERHHAEDLEDHARLQHALDGALSEVERMAVECEQLRLQLPKGMEHCTIRFIECEKGHGRLTATNWVEHGCYHCEIEALRSLLKRGATLSYRGQGWRVIGLTLCGSTATYDTEDAALDAAVKAILEEKS